MSMPLSEEESEILQAATFPQKRNHNDSPSSEEVGTLHQKIRKVVTDNLPESCKHATGQLSCKEADQGILCG